MTERNDYNELLKTIAEQLLSSLNYLNDGRIWLAKESIENILDDIFNIDMKEK